jgi:NitT/TauT family transport system ATP-binding protein
MLKISKLNFSYGKKNILKDLSLTLASGEIVAIIGSSGSGKTTLFQLISGLLNAPKHSIEICGKHEVRDRKKYISYMMQEDLLLPWKTLIGNLMQVYEFEKQAFSFFSFRAKRDLKKLLKQKTLDLLEDVGLAKFVNYYPNQLSGGMRQRASLARSLLFKKELILLDEPFGAIDFVRRNQLYELVKELHKKYLFTLVFITHDINDALELSDKIYELNNGKLEQYKPNDIGSDEKLEDLLVKDQKMKIFL